VSRGRVQTIIRQGELRIEQKIEFENPVSSAEWHQRVRNLARSIRVLEQERRAAIESLATARRMERAEQHTRRML